MRRQASEAEIETLGVPALGHEDVCRFDVAVDYDSGISSIECIGDPDSKRQYCPA
jgi:hypothetical protein